MSLSSDSAGNSRAAEWRVTSLYSGQSVRVAARGELDLETAPELDAALCDAEERGRKIVLDLRALTFMDSSGVNLLMRHVARAQIDGFVLSVIPPVASVARVLHIAGIWPLLPVADAAPQPRAGNSDS